MSRIHLALATAMLIAPATAHAAELRIATASEATSVDPHFHNAGPNNTLRKHIFEALVRQDAAQMLEPELAASWSAIDDTTWEFKLREGVTFSNGMDFTAKDVIYSFCRIPTVENSPSSFTPFVRGIVSIETPDDHTLVIKTESAQPLLASSLSAVGILSAELNGGLDVAYDPAGCTGLGTPPQSTDFNSTEIAVGTGPYQLVDFIRGQHVILSRNESYWGDAPAWERVTLRPVANQGARVAGLLAGDVDMIEAPPIQDFDNIRNAGAKIVQGVSNRVIYLHMDQHEEAGWTTPGVTGTDGKNPFLDRRVREAVSKAINREAIVDRVMGNVAVAAGELLPYPLFGTSEEMKPTEFDPEGAKALLAEAGYPDGFNLVLGTPNDRYMNDERVAQAIAQMFARIGIRTDIDAMTASTFFSRRNNFDFTVYLAGWGADTGEMANPLAALVGTRDTDRGLGSTNLGRYTNPALDDLIIEARSTVDDATREELLRKASRMAMEDFAILPLHFDASLWALRSDLDYEARADQHTLAFEVKPAN
jgi:peptide/nickel transport system substrate-binding protein